MFPADTRSDHSMKPLEVLAVCLYGEFINCLRPLARYAAFVCPDGCRNQQLAKHRGSPDKGGLLRGVKSHPPSIRIIAPFKLEELSIALAVKKATEPQGSLRISFRIKAFDMAKAPGAITRSDEPISTSVQSGRVIFHSDLGESLGESLRKILVFYAKSYGLLVTPSVSVKDSTQIRQGFLCIDYLFDGHNFLYITKEMRGFQGFGTRGIYGEGY